jgi:hypothetical protein
VGISGECPLVVWRGDIGRKFWRNPTLFEHGKLKLEAKFTGQSPIEKLNLKTTYNADFSCNSQRFPSLIIKTLKS